MCDALNITTRVDEKPDMMCSLEKFHGRRYKRSVLPYMMPGRRSVKRAVKSDPKGERCLHLNSGNDHATDCSKIMLSPSGTAGYPTDVTWGYWRAPYTGEWTTGSGGATPTAPPSPAKGGDVSTPTQKPEALQGFEVWYQQAPQANGATPVHVSSPPQPASSAQQRPRVTPAVSRSASRQHEPFMTSTWASYPTPPPRVSSMLQRQEALEPGASPEPLPPASPVSLPEAPVAGASLDPPLLPSWEGQEVQGASASPDPVSALAPPASSSKLQPRVSPAATRSPSQHQGGLGHMHELVSIVAAREDKSRVNDHRCRQR